MSTSTGSQAEAVAANYLQSIGFQVLARNWRTRLCEIDIIATRRGIVYFVEVKYRRTNRQGSGLDYITPAKLKQMEFAASCWVNENNFEGNYELAAIEVSEDFKVTEFLDSLS